MNLKLYEKKEKELPWVEQVIQMNTGVKPRYKRMGKCIRCGACCVNEDCEHLVFLDNGKAFCKIHNSKNRPDKCKTFPQLPPIIFKTCGYYFVDLIERKIIKPGESP